MNVRRLRLSTTKAAIVGLAASGLFACKARQSAQVRDVEQADNTENTDNPESATAPGADGGQVDMVYVFSAKGTNVAADFGITQVALDKFPALRANKVLLTGASSGSLMAGFFACRGFSDESMTELYKILTEDFQKSMMATDEGEKTKPFLEGMTIAKPTANVKPIIDKITQNGACKIKLPFMITAANLDVADDRGGFNTSIGGGALPWISKGKKEYDIANNAVYKKGQRNAEGYLGRLCTYFADRDTVNRLLKLPPSEVLCDIRPVDTGEELGLAITASVSEPTYFMPWPERNPEKLIGIGYDNFGATPVKSRTYIGGMGMTIVTQDAKRLYPDAKVFATGRRPFGGKTNAAMKAWYLVRLNDAGARSRWWVDAEIQYTEDDWNKNMSDKTLPANDAELGRKHAIACFEETESCAPTPIQVPDTRTDGAGNQISRKVQRGIGFLLYDDQYLAAHEEDGSMTKASYANAVKKCGEYRSGSTAFYPANDKQDAQAARLRTMFGATGCIWTSKAGSKGRVTFSLDSGTWQERASERDKCFVACAL